MISEFQTFQRLIFAILLTIVFSGCQNINKVQYNEVFTLQEGEVAEIEDIKLHLQSISWDSGDSSDRIYVELLVQRPGEPSFTLSIDKGKTVIIDGGYTISLLEVYRMIDRKCTLRIMRQ
ncbi:MAG: hypothetical protein H0T73_09710 [Ardenticatenales bacterium]|nr:hypothetical protein [Ardenticatenales bacterium]